MLSHSVSEIKGIGEKTREELALLDIYTIEDLLFYFPSRYNIFEQKPLGELVHNDQVTIVGKIIHDPTVSYYGRNRSRLIVMIEVEDVAVKAVMFNRAFAKKHLKKGSTFTFTGKWDAHRLQITVNQYKRGTPENNTNIQAIYSTKGSLSSHRIKKMIQQTFTAYKDEIIEMLPVKLLQAYKIPERKDALYAMHFPKSRLTLKHARRRFAYEELLLFQLKMQLLREINRKANAGHAQHYDPNKVARLKERLPFSLTKAQEQALNQILADMKSPLRMNRLLQGDVGSGKTAVASICLYAVKTANKQGALMVPTEILAEQHVQSLMDIFANDVKITLLTGSIKGKKRKERLAQIANGEIDVVIGTHALIQDDVVFNDLGLVIVDEQHRFGVEQRRTLRDKGLDPDVLFMTATPIPRTLAITAFGDMDVSIINEMPIGRKEVKTYWVKENTFERILNFIGNKVDEGEQAYIVSPLIEESDKLGIQNAVDLYQQLKAYYPSHINIGLIHGKLSNEEKDTVMREFTQNKIHILVSTTVVEVGVNVPNATVMVIYDAERFGLSQLHQLRGRVGRGDKQSYCILIADPKGEIGKQRMKIMTETNDGFRLSEEDLKLRGPGDFFGKKQSGLPEFKVADLVHDYRALEVARQDALEIINERLLERDEAYFPLLRYIEANHFFDEQLD